MFVILRISKRSLQHAVALEPAFFAKAAIAPILPGVAMQVALLPPAYPDASIAQYLSSPAMPVFLVHHSFVNASVLVDHLDEATWLPFDDLPTYESSFPEHFVLHGLDIGW